MSNPDESAEKSLDPTPRKLEQARKKGDLVRSADISVTAAYAGLLTALTLTSSFVLSRTGAFLQGFIEHPDSLSDAVFGAQSEATVGWFLAGAIGPATVWFTIPAGFVILAVAAQRAWVFAPSKLAPKLSRISPISNAKNKFGPSGLFEFAKSFAKLLVFGIALGVFLGKNRDQISSSLLTSPRQSILSLAGLFLQFLLIVVLVSAMIAALDYSWQRFDYIRRNRMSPKEVRDEHKEAEGDPEFKQRRRARAQEIASNQMLQDVPEAAVVIVNPTHFAIALRWDPAQDSAPLCVAKGVDQTALEIRKRAEKAGVPIHHDPPTARALYASTEIGGAVDPSLYRPVAAAIRFAETMRAQVKRTPNFGKD